MNITITVGDFCLLYGKKRSDICAAWLKSGLKGMVQDSGEKESAIFHADNTAQAMKAIKIAKQFCSKRFC